MDELITLVSDRAGIAPDKAREAVDTVFNFLKGKLGIGEHLSGEPRPDENRA
jgi:nucleoid DNA-binding protein